MDRFGRDSVRHTVTRLHLCASNVHSGPFSVYGNTTPQTVYCYLDLPLGSLISIFCEFSDGLPSPDILQAITRNSYDISSIRL